MSKPSLLRLQSLDNLLATLTNLNPDPAFQSQLQELKNEVDAYRATRQEEISLIYAGKVTEAQQMDSAVGADEFDKIQALEAAMAKDANSKTDQQLVTDQQTARSATGLFLAIAVIVVFLAIVLVAFLNQTIARPLTSITKVAAQIGEGNLTVNLPDVGRRDEIGALTSAFRQMIETLRRQTVDLSEAVGQLGSSASEILAATTQVATGTAEIGHLRQRDHDYRGGSTSGSAALRPESPKRFRERPAGSRGGPERAESRGRHILRDGPHP